MTEPSVRQTTPDEAGRTAPAAHGDYVEALIGQAARTGRTLLPLLFLFSVVALVYYLFKGYLPEFHSDSAVKNLLAEEVLRQGSYFPSDWNYVNGDLWVVFGQAFIIPLLPFLPNGFALHGVSGLVSAVILLSSLWWASSMLIASRWMRLLVITIFAGGVHWVMAEHLFGQVSYGNVLFLCALTLCSGWRLLESQGTRRLLGWSVVFVVLNVLTFWGNPQRAAAYDFLPMAAGVGAWLWGRPDLLVWKPGARRWAGSPLLYRAVLLMGLMAVAGVIGTLLHGHAVAGVNNAEGAGSARYLSFDGFLTNLKFTVMGILGTFGALPHEGMRVMSAAGAYQAARFLSLLVFLGLLPLVAGTLLRAVSPSARMFAGFTFSGLLVFLFLQVTTTTPDMSGPIISARYLVPFLVLAVVALAAYAEQRGVRRLGGVAAWGVLLMLASSLIDPTNSFARIYRGMPASPHLAQAAELERRGLSYGYASFWNANVISVISEGKVRVRPVLLQDGLPSPHRHLSSNQWFRPSAWNGKTFLMLSPDELKGLDRARLEHAVGVPVETFKIGDMDVLVFAGNIAARLQGWDMARSRSYSLALPIGAQSRHEIGQLVEDQGRAVLQSEAGQVGFLHFGPYLFLPEGNYQLTVELLSGSAADGGRVEVVADEGRRVLATAPIPSGASTLVMPVANAQDTDLVEVRVFSNGTGTLELRGLALLPEGKGPLALPAPAPVPSLPAQERAAVPSH